MKILLIDIPLSDVNNNFAVLHKEILFPSLGLYYLRQYSIAQDSELNIKVLNLALYSFDDGIHAVLNEKPDVIGISCFTDRRALVFNFIKKIKELQPKIISVIGGGHATALSAQILKNYSFIDFIARGEGEITFFELLQTLKNKTENFSKINGLSFRQNNNIIINPERIPVLDLDIFPYPQYNELPGKTIKFTHYDGRYLFNGKNISELKTMSIITSRGCPFKCTYCSTTAFWGRKPRYRSAENVIGEIEYLYKIHNVEFINIIDDAFTINRKRAIEICDAIIKKHIKICWICETNVKTIDDELIKKMGEAGCFAINYGVESGSPAILANIKKNISQEEIINAINLAKKYNILADIFLMVGNQGENDKTINETISILKRAKPSSGGWGILTVFPDTELYKHCKETGYISDEFWLSDYCSPFYLQENSYLQLQIYLNKIKCFFLWKNKNRKLWIRYKLLELRDRFWQKIGIRLSFKKGIEIIRKHKFLNKLRHVIVSDQTQL